MSESTIETAMQRIKYATEGNSKIAVFKTQKRYHVNALFADTLATQYRIKCNDPFFIGIFDASMNPFDVRKKISKRLKDEA